MFHLAHLTNVPEIIKIPSKLNEKFSAAQSKSYIYSTVYTGTVYECMNEYNALMIYEHE